MLKQDFKKTPLGDIQENAITLECLRGALAVCRLPPFRSRTLVWITRVAPVATLDSILFAAQAVVDHLDRTVQNGSFDRDQASLRAISTLSADHLRSRPAALRLRTRTGLPTI
jgi:hypothetical protein